MLHILIKAACLVSIIVLGYVLKKADVFKKEDFPIFSHIVLDITLPGAIITNFSAFSFDFSLLSLAFLALGCCILLSAAGWFVCRRKSTEDGAFAIINCSGYNIGCFTMPYVQSFLGPTAVVAGYIFDAGNAVIANGGAYGVASSLSNGGKISLKFVGKKLLTSVPFMTYLIMLIMASFQIPVPSPVVTLAGIAGSANSFMAMLMLGVGFELSLERRYLSQIGKILLLRYSISAVLALVFYYVLPFPLEIRQVLTAIAFGPICSAAVPYTGKLGGDVGLSGAINSCSIVISIVLITSTLMVMGL